MSNRSEETIDKIINAAQKVFSRFGYNGAGVAEICDEAGISKGAFYHHFESKQALFLRLLQDWLSGLDDHFNKIRATSANPRETMLRMAGSIHIIFEAADGRLPMFVEYWSQASRDPLIWQATIEPYHRYINLIAELLQEMANAGKIKLSDANSQARVIVSVALGMILQGLLDTDNRFWSQMAEEGVRVVLDGLERSGS